MARAARVARVARAARVARVARVERVARSKRSVGVGSLATASSDLLRSSTLEPKLER